MVRNVTIALPEDVVETAERIARGSNRPLDEWLAEVMAEAVRDRVDYAEARRHALEMMKKGFNLGGKPLTRDEIYDRGSGLR